jgi:hypothetical protein
MEINDLLGRVEKSKPLGVITPGENTFRFSIVDLPAGIYSLKLNLSDENGKRSYLYKVIISR